jgi:hypothetical protein
MSPIRYISAKLAQQVQFVAGLRCLHLSPAQIDEELMGQAGAFSLDQVSSGCEMFCGHP